MVEIIPPADPLVPLAAPAHRPRHGGRDDRPPSRFAHPHTFHEELARSAMSYARDEHGMQLRAARLDDDGRLAALIVDVARTTDGRPRTTVAVLRGARRLAGSRGAPLLQPGRLVDIIV